MSPIECTVCSNAPGCAPAPCSVALTSLTHSSRRLRLLLFSRIRGRVRRFDRESVILHDSIIIRTIKDMGMNVDRNWDRNGNRGIDRGRWDWLEDRSRSRRLILFPFAFAMRRDEDTIKGSFPFLFGNLGNTISSSNKKLFIFQLIDSKFQFFFSMSNKVDRAGSPSSSRVTFIGLQNSLISNSEEALTIRESNTASLIPRESSFGDKIIDLVTAIYTMALNTTSIASDGATRGTRKSSRSSSRGRGRRRVQ